MQPPVPRAPITSLAGGCGCLPSGTPGADAYGVSSFVYRAYRPFEPARLLGCLGTMDETARGMLRSKGFFWLATRHDTMGVWSTIGAKWTADGAGP